MENSKRRFAVEEEFWEAEKQSTPAQSVAGFGIWDWDIQSDQLFLSPLYLKRLGLRENSRYSYQDFLALVHPDDRGVVDAQIQKSLAGKETDYAVEYRLIFAEDTVCWFATKVQFSFENGKPIRALGLMTDINEQKQNESRIQLLNQVYTAVAQINRIARHSAKSPSELFDAVCRIAVDYGGIKMAWVGMNKPGSDCIEAIAGYGANLEYLNGIVISIRPDVPEGLGLTGTALREGRAVLLQDFATSPITIPWQARSLRTGNWHASAAFPIIRNGAPYAVLTLYHSEKNAFNELIVSLLNVMVDDIGFALDAMDADAERQAILRELRQSEERYRSLLNLVPDQIWIAQPDGRIDYANQRALDYFGCSLDEMVDYGWQNIVHPDDFSYVMAALSEAFQTGKNFEGEYRIRHRSGEYRWCSARAHPSFDDAGHIKKWYGITTDISERKRAEERQRLTARIFDSTLEGIIVTDTDCQIIEVNDAFMQITGYTREDVIGKNPRFLQSDRHGSQFYQAMWQAINTTGHWSGEIWNRRKDGVVYPEWTTLSAITDANGKVSHYVGISSDITLLKQHEKQLEFMAHYDALTGIPNRVLLVDRMRLALAQTRREQNLLAVCYLDLDGFKPVNDTMGHNSGDLVLVEIANRIIQSLRGGDTVARLGGDEFVILLLGIENAEDCQNSLNRLISVIAQTIYLQGQPFNFTASIGVALYPQDDEDPDTLIRHADQAMYLAKKLGKNRYHIFDPAEDVLFKSHNEKISTIEHGLIDNQFELFYQPKVALDQSRIVGAEALIRWQHPERGLLPPNEFLPLIENTELDIRLGEWVISTVLMQMERWRQEGLSLEISCNISANHVQSPGFVSKLQQQLGIYPDLPPHQLQLEILETTALSDIATVLGIIETCAAMGISFALDDFGTGYSSLAYLRRLPFNTIKIDKSFVRDMLIDADDRAIVQGVIALADTFNRITVAEGVETQEHLIALRDMGCDIAQGYGIARPMPASEFARWCRSF